MIEKILKNFSTILKNIDNKRLFTIAKGTSKDYFSSGCKSRVDQEIVVSY